MSDNLTVTKTKVQIHDSIVTFELSPTGESIEVEENCDYYYNTGLGKKEIDELIAGLQALRNQMK